MASTCTPTLLALSRQNLPTVRSDASENLTAKGAYVLRDVAKRDVTLIATGSEVEIALAAADLLAAEGIHAAVVSAPSFELFAQQPADYRAAVLGTAPRVGIEAAIRQSWDAVLRSEDAFIGMTGFGASAPAPALYAHFGITKEAAVEAARKLTGK
jgi:transketolase